MLQDAFVTCRERERKGVKNTLFGLIYGTDVFALTEETTTAGAGQH